MRELLLDLYYTALRAADPAAAVTRELTERPLPSTAPAHIVAVGKAARGMTGAALATLTACRIPLAGGIIVGPEAGPAGSSLPALAGDHPLPGINSARAADAIAQAVAAIPGSHQALVLLSGGASSLAAAPVEGVSSDDLVALWRFLLGSGQKIGVVNAIRKRCLRWGAGRLAAALAPRPVTVLCISDVIGDDPGTVGSGPCAPDPRWGREVLSLLESVARARDIPPSVRRLLERQASGALADTLKPGDPAFRNVTTHVIASNRLAIQGVRRRAQELGLPVIAGASDLSGDAREAGTRLGAFLRAGGGGANCFIWGGETTVSLGEGARGLGGRCQELALAAAAELDDVPGVALLAAGTDGRDGPTDAAGALVDGTTWARIAERGRDPEADLAAHDAYHALDAADALLRTGPTGTNVMDVVIGLRQRPVRGAPPPGADSPPPG
jgi:glycerate 2-kinase